MKFQLGPKLNFQSCDLEDRETQEAMMSVCMYVCLSVSQKIIRFKLMNSSVNFRMTKVIRYS